ncbi:unnamed protein product [Symbiodinium necroappetens]|uniref:Uncharacterized protein n=1 Tax=Symbiodinium necroappetens TaxID=1628268 RepID=A0A812PS78_9DINO|nr:unnamed protein product [Symbiodinium necroappetens]
MVTPRPLQPAVLRKRILWLPDSDDDVEILCVKGPRIEIDLVTPPRSAAVHATPPPAALEASEQQMARDPEQHVPYVTLRKDSCQVKAEKPEEVELRGVKREVDSPPCTPPRKVPAAASLAMFPFRTPPRLRRGFQVCGYLQARTCDLQMRERLRSLLCQGWPSPSPSEAATRESIAELLGLCPSTGKPGKPGAATYLAWALAAAPNLQTSCPCRARAVCAWDAQTMPSIADGRGAARARGKLVGAAVLSFVGAVQYVAVAAFVSFVDARRCVAVSLCRCRQSAMADEDRPATAEEALLVVVIFDHSDCGTSQETAEWHFKAPALEAELAKLRAQREALRQEEIAALRRRDETVAEGNRREQELLDGAAAAEGARVAEFAALRERMGEVKDQVEDTLAEAEEKELALAEECRGLRAERIETEKGLREEAAKLRAVTRRTEELEDAEREELRRMAAAHAAVREAARKRSKELQEQTEKKAREMRNDLVVELEKVHAELKKAKEGIYEGVQAEVVRRQQVVLTVDDEIKSIDRVVNENLEEAKDRARHLEDRTHRLILETQARDFALETKLCDHVARAVAALEVASTVKAGAAVEHKDAERRRRGTAKALGDVFPRSTNFNLVGMHTAKPTSKRSSQTLPYLESFRTGIVAVGAVDA